MSETKAADPRTYHVVVTLDVEVTLDASKFTPEFFGEYNNSITYRGGDDGDIEWALKNHAEHLAWVHATGVEDLESRVAFVEGYGPASDMGIRAIVTDADSTVSSS